jgi:WD40 repeat protein
LWTPARSAAPGWLVGFDDEMMDVCFLPRAAGEAERVVCATTSHAARVYTLGSPGLGGADFLAGHGGPVLACAAAHDFILTGSKDQTARVWSCADLRCVAVCAGHGDAVSALAAFAASRHFVTAGGEDGTVRLWCVARGRQGGVLTDAGWRRRPFPPSEGTRPRRRCRRCCRSWRTPRA